MRLVMMPGAGSTPGFLMRAFAQSGELAVLGTHGCVPARGQRAFKSSITPGDVAGGVSYGAHQAVRFACAAPVGLRAVVAVLPAWTGAPGAVAAATGAAAASVRALGVDAELDRLKSGSADWVLDELESAWRGRDGSELADELLQAARSRGPTEDELSSLKVPLLAIAVSDDPLHPESVARQWSALAPDAHLVVLDRASLQADRAVLGAVVRSGLDELLGPSGSP